MLVKPCKKCQRGFASPAGLFPCFSIQTACLCLVSLDDSALIASAFKWVLTWEEDCWIYIAAWIHNTLCSGSVSVNLYLSYLTKKHFCIIILQNHLPMYLSSRITFTLSSPHLDHPGHPGREWTEQSALDHPTLHYHCLYHCRYCQILGFPPCHTYPASFWICT